MSKIPFSVSDRSLTFYVNGQPYSIDRSAPAWDELKSLIQTEDPDVARLIRLTNPIEAVASAIESAEEVEANYLPKGKVGVTREGVTYNGETLHGVLTGRIMDLLSEGFDIMPMVRFLENLMQNPTAHARDELYLWLETSDMPITDDGHFLAYKNVRGDFKSIHGGTVDNTPGTYVEMDRSKVDKNRHNTCSAGLHFCSKSYLPSFSSAVDGKTVLLKINPADVVSIPSDYSNAKGRAWKYFVLEEVGFDIGAQRWPAVYSTDDDDSEYDLDDDVAMLEFPSDLSKALFAALAEVGVEDRFEFASDILGRDIESFRELTEEDAADLLSALREIKAEEDADAEADAQDVLDAAEEARRATINGYGIITLRSKASANGYKAATGVDPWKGARSDDLKAYLIGLPGVV